MHVFPNPGAFFSSSPSPIPAFADETPAKDKAPAATKVAPPTPPPTTSRSTRRSRSSRTRSCTPSWVEFKGIRGDRVPAYLYLPRQEQEPQPAVLLQYGIGGNKNTNLHRRHGQTIRRAGFVVLTIDAPDVGDARPRTRRFPPQPGPARRRPDHALLRRLQPGRRFPHDASRGGQGPPRLRRHQSGAPSPASPMSPMSRASR